MIILMLTQFILAGSVNFVISRQGTRRYSSGLYSIVDFKKENEVAPVYYMVAIFPIIGGFILTLALGYFVITILFDKEIK